MFAGYVNLDHSQMSAFLLCLFCEIPVLFPLNNSIVLPQARDKKQSLFLSSKPLKLHSAIGIWTALNSRATVLAMLCIFIQKHLSSRTASIGRRGETSKELMSREERKEIRLCCGTGGGRYFLIRGSYSSLWWGEGRLMSCGLGIFGTFTTTHNSCVMSVM